MKSQEKVSKANKPVVTYIAIPPHIAAAVKKHAKKNYLKMSDIYRAWIVAASKKDLGV